MNIPQENSPDLWRKLVPQPQADSHKYSRGTALIRGGAVMTGAARLAARAAQRMGAGLVTIAAPGAVVPIYAGNLESVIVHACDDPQSWQTLVYTKYEPALLIGPGIGIDSPQMKEVLISLIAKRSTVLDADALTNFADNTDALLNHVHEGCVLTPHEGEFAKLFGAQIAGDKIMRTSNAAQLAKCVVLLKGAETIIAAPDGRIIINRNATPWLATAGSGDVLSGMITGLIAQKMEPFYAAAAAAWMHGKIGNNVGPALIAEDIVAGIPSVLKEIVEASESSRLATNFGNGQANAGGTLSLRQNSDPPV